jgi:transcriptional regulator with GAF, ATPase, and Fis domain
VSLTASQLRRLTASRNDTPQEFFDEVARTAAEAMGCALFTVMRLDPGTQEVERLYSTDRAIYPLGGRKKKRDTDWARQVLKDQRLFIGEGDAAIRAAFDDHETIIGLGLHSIINVPLTANDGACIGTLNFLMRQPKVTNAEVEIARKLATLAATVVEASRI